MSTKQSPRKAGQTIETCGTQYNASPDTVQALDAHAVMREIVLIAVRAAGLNIARHARSIEAGVADLERKQDAMNVRLGAAGVKLADLSRRNGKRGV